VRCAAIPLAIIATTTMSLGCGNDVRKRPSVLDPTLSEAELRGALGVPADADRVLVLGQSSHLDIDWRHTFDAYYKDFVQDVLLDAEDVLERDPAAYYAVAEMAFLDEHVARHGAAPWRRHAGTGRARIVGGGLTTPDTLLPTDEALIRDYLLGSIVADELGARAHTAWLPDSFGHSPTVPDVLSAAGYTAVGFGRADGARHTFEIVFGDLEPIVPGVETTASYLRELGTADFLWRGPGGGEVLAHYMPVREYCQGDTIDLDGFTLNGVRAGVDHEGDREFVLDRLAEYIDQLTPYQRTPYLFVPIGCDFQRPRPRLTEYARWWNENRYASTGVWVVAATFEDFARFLSFHRAALPVMERDITPVWTGFYASRPRIKRLARAAAESAAAVEPFLSLVDPGAAPLGEAWRAIALANHHDWITGTSEDTVVADEQLPILEGALAAAELAWSTVLDRTGARIDSSAFGAGELVLVFNPGPVDRSGVVEVTSALRGPVHAIVDGVDRPAQSTAGGRIAFVAADVPAFGWRTFVLEPGVTTGASAFVDSDRATVSTGRLDARFDRAGDGWALTSLVVGGDELLGAASLEWISYVDSGGLYRIGSERPDCAGAEFREAARVRIQTLEQVEAGPARVTLRGTAMLDGRAMTIEIVAEAGAERLQLRVTGTAARGRTVAVRVRPRAPEASLTMGVAGGVTTRPLEHHYAPSWWPAVTWVARGTLAVHLAQSTGVRGSDDGTLEWIALRNAESEQPCDDVGPRGTDDGEATIEVSFGRRDAASSGAVELAASMELTRHLRAISVARHTGELPATGRLIEIEGDGVVATALKPATRGGGWVLHLLRPGAASRAVTVRRGVLAWSSMSRPDLLERDDRHLEPPIDGVVEVTLDGALTALRLRKE
jgi:hypothetical protein